MKVTPEGIKLIKSFEQCRLKAYPDPGTGGKPWTIGWGSTGAHITKDTVWTQQEADDQFVKDLGSCRAMVEKQLKCTLNDNQFSAVISLVYNIGIGNFIGHDLLKYLNAGNIKAAADEFPKWNKAAGKVLAGLTRRRAAEQKLFLS